MFLAGYQLSQAGAAEDPSSMQVFELLSLRILLYVLLLWQWRSPLSGKTADLVRNSRLCEGQQLREYYFLYDVVFHPLGLLQPFD